MATVSISFDTVSKDLAVSVDGAAIEGVANVYIGQKYRYNPDTGMDETKMGIEIITKDQPVDGLHSHTRLCGSVSPEPDSLPAFVENELSQLVGR